MTDYFKQNRLNLNLGKSGYLIITTDKKKRKTNLTMNNGFIKYKNILKYLGILISDTGNIKKDTDLFVMEKRRDIYIKFTNFCARNYLAPLKVKLDVLKACVTSTLLYGCECWGRNNTKRSRQSVSNRY